MGPLGLESTKPAIARLTWNFRDLEKHSRTNAAAAGAAPGNPGGDPACIGVLRIGGKHCKVAGFSASAAP